MDPLKKMINAKKDFIITVDIGGTKMHSVLIKVPGTIMAEHRIEHKKQPPDDHFEDLVQIITTTLQDDSCRIDNTAICIGVNSPVSGAQGNVVWAPALGWKNRMIGAELQKKFSIPVKIENDANLACLGEWLFGAGKGYKNVVSVFLGTGIGAGIVLDGKLYCGAKGYAGEMGRMPIGVDSLSENRHEGFGALESVSSGYGIAQSAKAHANEMKKEISGISTETAISAYSNGEEWAVKAVGNSLDHLSIALSQIICLLDPEVIIFGGGVANSFSLIRKPLQERLNLLIPHVPDLVRAKLGSMASAFGAQYYFQ